MKHLMKAKHMALTQRVFLKKKASKDSMEFNSDFLITIYFTQKIFRIIVNSNLKQTWL